MTDAEGWVKSKWLVVGTGRSRHRWTRQYSLDTQVYDKNNVPLWGRSPIWIGWLNRWKPAMHSKNPAGNTNCLTFLTWPFLNTHRLIGPIMGMNMQFGVQYCAYGFPYQRIHLPLLVIEAWLWAMMVGWQTHPGQPFCCQGASLCRSLSGCTQS